MGYNAKFRFIVFICVMMMALSSVGCVDFYGSKHPKMSETDIWISDDPSAYFLWDNEKGGRIGEIILDGVWYPFVLAFDYGAVAEFFQFNGEASIPNHARILTADCKFSPDKLVLEVGYSPKDIGLTNTKIVFQRKDFDPETEEKPDLSLEVDIKEEPDISQLKDAWQRRFADE